MTARVTAGSHPAGAAALTDARAGTAARASGLLDAGAAASSTDHQAGAEDAPTGSGSNAAQPFAAALANATHARGANTVAGGAPRCAAAGAGAAPGGSGGSSSTAPAAGGTQRAAAWNSVASGGAAQASVAARSSAQGSSLESATGGSAAAASADRMDGAANAAAVSAAVGAAADNGCAAALASADASAGGTASADADSIASLQDPSSTEATTPSAPGQPAHAGRSRRADDSGAEPAGALALLQSAAASLAAAFQNMAAGVGGASDNAGSGDDPGPTGSSALAGGKAGPVLAATAPAPGGPQAAGGASAAVDALAGQAAAGMLTLANGSSSDTSAGGASHAPTHGASVATDAGPGSAAARAASWMPQLLSAMPVAAGSDGVARAITVPMSDPSWPQALAAQVHWLAGNQVQSATLRLSPEHLGPIQVRIDLQQSQINLNFSAAHAETRAALTDAMPQLRDMLAAGGLSLGQANVQQDAPGGRSTPPPRAAGLRSSVETVDPVAFGISRALGLVDEYV